jgi:hypothetical protein
MAVTFSKAILKQLESIDFINVSEIDLTFIEYENCRPILSPIKGKTYWYWITITDWIFNVDCIVCYRT